MSLSIKCSPSKQEVHLLVVVLMLLRASDTNIAGELYVALAFSRT